MQIIPKKKFSMLTVFLSEFTAHVQKKEEIIFYNFEINYKMNFAMKREIISFRGSLCK